MMMRHLPPSTSVLGVIAQMNASPLETHRCRIRIGGTDPEIRGPQVSAMDVSLLLASFRHPVVSGSIVCRQLLAPCLREDDGEKRGQWGENNPFRVFRKEDGRAGF